MENQFIKKLNKDELEKMDAEFLIERILLLEEQLKIRSDREDNFNKVIHLTLEMLKLDHSSLAALLGKYQFELASEDPELTQRLIISSEKFEEIRKYIVDNHCMKDTSGESFFNIEYNRSEWIDDNEENPNE